MSRAFFVEDAGHHPDFFLIDCLRDDDIVAFFSQTLDSASGATFVATLEGKAIGYITVFVRSQPSFYRIKRVGAVSGLMVRQDHRRKGIATKLLGESIAFFKEQGVECFTVYPATSNESALTFYARRGFLVPLYTTLIGTTGDTS